MREMSVLTVFSIHIEDAFIQMMISTAPPTHTSVRPCPQMTVPRPPCLPKSTPSPGATEEYHSSASCQQLEEVEGEQKDADLLSDYIVLSITPSVVGSGDGRSHDGHVTGEAQ